MNRQLIWIIAVVVLIFIGMFVLLTVGLIFAVVGAMGRSDAHVCGLAAVQSSPAAKTLLGTPITQRGFTGGSSSTQNGELAERMTFTVSGPRGTAFVVSEGRRSPLASHLEVTMGRDQRSITVYNGPFDCPQLHRPSS